MKLMKIPKHIKITDVGRHLIKMFGEVSTFNSNKDGLVVELGVRYGVSTNILASACKSCGFSLLSIDNKDCSEACNWKDWNFIIKDSIEVGKEYNGELIDILFIDTSHSKEQVIGELNAWIPHMKDNCMFIFHDTNPINKKRVKTALEEGGVIDGINNFFNIRLNNSGNYYKVYYDDDYIYYISHNDYSHGMTYIKRSLKDERD